MKTGLLCVLFFVLMFTTISEARNRLETYVDKNGVRRVQKTGKIYRDYKAVNDFKHTHPKPEDGHAYDVDHIIPLSRGGADKPYNMQWIRVEDHRKKQRGRVENGFNKLP